MAEVTHHAQMLSLLGEWVTVTHPDAPHRVWHGQLASLMDCPSLILQMPGGGTEVLPQEFDVAGAAPAADGPHPDADTDAHPFSALRPTGLLWLINRVAPHPRGLALALHLDEHGQAYGWSLLSNDDGEPWTFDPATDNDGYARAEATIAKALERESDSSRCRVCHGGPAEVRNSLGTPLCSACLHCDCGQDVCLRTAPDASGQSGPPATTSTDTVRTHPDVDLSPEFLPGLRVEYRTRVPRNLAPFALAEAIQAVADVRTAHDDTIRAHPDTAAQPPVRARPPILGTGRTSTDTVRTGHPDTPEWKVCGDRRCIDPRCREEATLAEARERLATTMELPLDLIAPVRCDGGQTGSLVGEAANGHHFHISPEQHEALLAQQEDGPAKTAWGKCWDRAEALRADLDKAHAAYDALRARVITTSKYVHQQQTAGFPFRGGDHRQRILDTLAVWTEDPGPLQLTTLTPSETP
ncbi:hypothetical protein ACFV4X_26405 [Streptomyces ardesiacus]|uniref:hypothetical protein n=1 Tax=Streptomyces ardesiacus TaxID=285564 RepID=UPI00365E1CAC